MKRIRFIFVAAIFALLSALSSPLQAAITIVSGNGQLTKCPFSLCTAYFPDFQPLVVRVTDLNGQPQPNVAVSWTVTQGFTVSLLAGATTTTDAAGIATNDLIYTVPRQLSTVPEVNTVVATAVDSSSTTFILTAAPAPRVVGPQYIVPVVVTPQAYLQGLLAGNILTGQAGTASNTPIEVFVGTDTGQPIPNVSIQLVSLQDPAVGPVVTCQSMGLSDARGIVSCIPQFSGTPGSGRFYVLLGYGGGVVPDPTVDNFQATTIGFQNPIRLTVTPAAVTSIRVVSGNAQTANPNQTLPLPLVVETLSSTGVPIAGQQVRWTANPAGAINIVEPVTTTDLNGRTSITPRLLGNANGAIQVTATVEGNTSLSTVFTITALPQVTITGISIFSGNNQSAPVGTAFAQPLVIQVSTSSGSAAGLPVQFTSSGTVMLSATSATTDANGRAQVTATAGSFTGPATVTASIPSNTGTGSQTFSLTVLPAAPNITSSSFVNGADLQINSLSPCSIGIVQAPVGTLGVSNSGPLFPGQPLPSSTVQLLISNVSAPIRGIATGTNGQQQISFQVPCQVTPGSSVPASLNIGGGATPVNLGIQAASPGIFQNLGLDNVLRAVAIRPDGSFVTTSNPARRGENVSIFVTGLGATSPSVGTNSVPVPGTSANVLGTVIVGMAGSGVPVVSAKLTEDLPGMYLVTFMIPSDMQTGSDVSISVALIPQGSGTPIYSATTKISVL